jgi:hypothetical protein
VPSVGPVEDPYSPTFAWPVAIAAALIIAAALVATAIARSRRRKVVRSTPAELVAELTSLVDIALEDLRTEADPRRAVIAAYARMERALASFGLARHAFEAPFEYLERVEPRLAEDLPAARDLVDALTRLFERAKFSPHEIDLAMKEEAVDTLTALRDGLVARQEEHDAAVV